VTFTVCLPTVSADTVKCGVEIMNRSTPSTWTWAWPRIGRYGPDAGVSWKSVFRLNELTPFAVAWWVSVTFGIGSPGGISSPSNVGA